MKKLVSFVVLMSSINVFANVISPMEPLTITKATVEASQLVRNKFIAKEKSNIEEKNTLGVLKVVNISITKTMINYNFEYSNSPETCVINVTVYPKENNTFNVYDNGSECQ